MASKTKNQSFDLPINELYFFKQQFDNNGNIAYFVEQYTGK